MNKAKKKKSVTEIPRKKKLLPIALLEKWENWIFLFLFFNLNLEAWEAF